MSPLLLRALALPDVTKNVHKLQLIEFLFIVLSAKKKNFTFKARNNFLVLHPCVLYPAFFRGVLSAGSTSSAACGSSDVSNLKCLAREMPSAPTQILRRVKRILSRLHLEQGTCCEAAENFSL